MTPPSTIRPGLLQSVPWWGWALLVVTLLIVVMIVRAIPPAPLPPVDYFALANAARGPECPPEENFYAGLLQLLSPTSRDLPPNLRASLMTAIQVPPPPKGSPQFDLNLPKDDGDLMSQELSGRYFHFMDVLWSADDDPVLAAYVAKNDAALDAMQAVARRSGSWRPLTKDGDFLMSCQLGELQPLRSIARLYYLRIGLRLKAGDMGGAEQDLMTIYRMARHAGQGTMLLELLIANWLEINAHHSAALWMMHPDVTREQRSSFLAEFRTLKPIRTVAYSIDKCDRYMALEVVATMANPGPLRREAWDFIDDSRSDVSKWLKSNGILRVDVAASFDGNTAINLLDSHFDEWVRMAKVRSVAEQIEAAAELQRKTEAEVRKFVGGKSISWGRYLYKSYKERGIVVGIIASDVVRPDGMSALKVQQRNLAGHDLLAIAIAAADYRAASRRWPASTADLPPEIVVLRDPCSGDAYILREIDGKSRNLFPRPRWQGPQRQIRSRRQQINRRRNHHATEHPTTRTARPRQR